MDSRPQPPGGQQELLGNAETLEAASRLVWCSGRMLHDRNRPVFDAMAAWLALYASCVRQAVDHSSAASSMFEEELLRDMEAAGIDPSAPPAELLDEYVACQLAGMVAALSALKFVYQEGDSALSQRAGSALFVAVHWVECARRDLEEQVQRQQPA